MDTARALYYPIIRGRLGELTALHYLSPAVRAKIAPLIDLPTIDSDDPKALEEHVGHFIASLTPAWGVANSIYIDLSRYHPGQTDRKNRHIAAFLFDCVRQAKLKAIPVTGSLAERGPGSAYLDAVASAAKLGGRGAALRLSHIDYRDAGELTRELQAGLSYLALPPEQVDLFLDAESIALMPPDFADEERLLAELKEAVRTAEAFKFRSIVFIGSSVPENLKGSKDGKPLMFARTELRVWKRYLSLPGTSLIGFGDTGVWNPRQPDTGGGGGPAPARVRVPLNDQQIFFRDESTNYRALCQTALKHPGVRNLPPCWGLESLRKAGRGSGNVDNASGWVARDTNLHIESTAYHVEGILKEQGRLSGVTLATPESQLWQQTNWTEIFEEDQ